MNRAILIELVGYTPTLLYCLNKEEMKTVKEEIGVSAVRLFEWGRDKMKHNLTDIVELACKEKKDWIVYLILSFSRMHNAAIVTKVATYNRVELLEFMIEDGVDNWNLIAWGAARGGHIELVNFAIEKGADGFCDIAGNAAKGGHKEIILSMIELGVDNWDYYAYCAARHGHKQIVELMVERGANFWNWFIQAATEGGHDDIVEYIHMIKLQRTFSSHLVL